MIGQLVYFRDAPWLGFGRIFSTWKIGDAPTTLRVIWLDDVMTTMSSADPRIVVVDDPRFYGLPKGGDST